MTAAFLTTPRVIGVAGFAGSGKNELANIISERGYGICAWADPVRNLAYAINPRIFLWRRLRYYVDKLGWDEAKRKIPAIRKFLQWVGTELCRDNIHPNVWVFAGSQKMKEGNWVVPDCRFVNEAEWVKRRGILILVKRPGVGPVNSHISDAGTIDHMADYVILNDGTLDDLRVKVGDLCQTLGIQ